MSCSEDFKGMPALAYSQQSLNMSKHSEKPKFRRLLRKQQAIKTAKGHFAYSQRRTRARAKRGGKERNAALRQANVMACSLQATTGESTCLKLLSSTQTCKYQNLEETNQKHNPKNLMWNVNAPPSAGNLARPPARKHTHTRMEWTPANTSALPAKQDQANIGWDSV